MKKKKIISTLFIAASAAMVNAQVTMNIDGLKKGPAISPYQYGLFFEEINHAGDGGLYAELVRNRSFEDANDAVAWANIGGATSSLVTDGLLNTAQSKALKLTTSGASKSAMQGIANKGYWGMNFVKGETYTLNFFVKASTKNFSNNIIAQLQTADGKTVVGEAVIKSKLNADEWTKLTVTIKADADAPKGRLALLTPENGTLTLDVVSLFPKTWKGRANGLRPDLAQLLADTHPKFLRFPGGCYVEGQESMDNAFRWKNTIGAIENRPGHKNVNWGYRSTDGLGFDEYLQLCEDMNCAPMFVVNVGLGHGFIVPMEDVDTLVQNTLDAIEYANGDASTFWGRKRIENGHEKPYNLKFIEIGNENYQTDANAQSQQYAERYYMFYDAIKEKYPDIITIGNVEAWGTDNPSWRNTAPVEMVDEHYYRSHSWMRDNYHKYDNYSRDIAVYNGEYAANAAGTYGKYGNMNSALGEAIYMLGMENNSDVCRMASFAPIFTHVKDPKWPYDMIHFDCAKNFCTPSYYVQKLMSENLGSQNLKWTETGNLCETQSTPVQLGFGGWNTQTSFCNLTIQGEAGQVVVVEPFREDVGWTNPDGAWKTASGIRSLTKNIEGSISVNPQKVNSSRYTYHLKARKDSGDEGFLIVFNYKDKDNYMWWNLGGWRNTQHGIEVCENGAKSTIASTSGKIEAGKWYDVVVEVDGNRIRCFLDHVQIHDITIQPKQHLYQSCQLSEDGSEMILKVVNPDAKAQTLNLNCSNMVVVGGTVTRYAGKTGLEENTLENPQNIVPQKSEVLSNLKTLNIPAYSLNIFRFDVE